MGKDIKVEVGDCITYVGYDSAYSQWTTLIGTVAKLSRNIVGLEGGRWVPKTDIIKVTSKKEEKATFQNGGLRLYNPFSKAFDEALDLELKKENKCTCGAKHTSFPEKHLGWCDLKAGG